MAGSPLRIMDASPGGPQELQNHALAKGKKIARMKGIVMSTYPQAILAHIECFFLFFYGSLEELP
jgi:hypothetical protein